MGLTEISPWDFTCAPFSLVGKDKMLLSATDTRGTNVMTVAWGGFGVMWGAPVAFFAVRPSRHTYGFAEDGERFSLMSLEDGHEAALAYAPPSGTYYHDGYGNYVTSLGTHEHWNNPIDRQYSRNLGLDKGIELLKRTHQ